MRRIAAATLVVLACSSGLARERPTDTLRDGFRDPPRSARPRVWWHWMNGNVTEDGIAKDLDWMARVGLGGVQTFDASLATPKVVERPLRFMSPAWRQAFKFAALRADALGLELGIAASPGWSETGGPWVTPKDGMKKIVWSETEVVPGTGEIVLGRPACASGPFQDIAAHGGLASGGDAPRPNLYRDVAVLAYPIGGSAPSTIYAAGGKALDATVLSDGRYTATIAVPRAAPDGEASVELRVATSQPITALTVALKPTGRTAFSPPTVLPILEARRDGSWQRIAEAPMLADVPATVAFAPVRATSWRVRFAPLPVQTTAQRVNAYPGAITTTYRPAPPPSTTIELAELRLSTDKRIDRFEAKAGYAVARDYLAIEEKGPSDEPGIASRSIIDLTGKMDAAGRLDWAPPPGRWRVVRMGWSLTGTLNHPATAAATGLEVDKLDGAAVTRYLEAYLALYRETLGPQLIGARGLRAITTDSFEAGAANWTPDMPRQFERRRGYALSPWLPALTGAVVESRAATDRFLYDYRRTIAELIADQHYRTIAQVAHRHGLRVYGEALEVARPSLGDDLAMRRHADIPMAAMWTYPAGGQPRSTFLADTKGAASVAHAYGRRFVAAESLTSGFNYWSQAPVDLKPVIDREFVQGINLPVIHTSVHQPSDTLVPGFSLLIFGQFFTRHETWGEMARPWIDYIARTSFLLQQGRDVADLAYFAGEEGPLTARFNDAPPADAPSGHGYDFIGADTLLQDVTVDRGDLVTVGGARYRALYLGSGSVRMTPALLRRLADLVEAGATVIGRAPTGVLGRESDTTFAPLVRSMWSGAPVNRRGKGKVIDANTADAGLAALGVAPDWYAQGAGVVHRRLGDGSDLYFVSNPRPEAMSIKARFRVTGRIPELWRADDGSTSPASWRAGAQDTRVALELAPHEAVFVVFRRRTAAPAGSAPAVLPAIVTPVTGDWQLAFQPGRGAPAAATAPPGSLATSDNAGIRYFSGIVRYARNIATPRGWRRGDPLSLDLGEVGAIAEVWVNGRRAGTAWKPPYRVAIGSLARPGDNRIEVRVATLWMNRLIGDAQPGADPITFTSVPTYGADAPLRPSGLIGPVSMISSRGR